MGKKVIIFKKIVKNLLTAPFLLVIFNGTLLKGSLKVLRMHDKATLM
jgi:hypothetical protein